MHIPKLGETRCYWTLLNANLQFLFLDPVLTVHMKDQADYLIGRSLLEFVHPDERQAASVDLHDVVEKQALHGTVTRVKYMRASYLRVLLGASTRDSFPHAKEIGFNDEYLPCDIVINWVAENLVLCFLHAIIDLSPQDNDERHKSHWTNWCSTITLRKEDSTLLYSRLFKADSIAPPSSSGGTFNPHRITDSTSPTRVFQILANAPTRQILFSWPAENYYPADFARLAANVRIDSSAAPQSQNDYPDPGNGGSPLTQAKTSCTRRYKSLQSFQSNGLVREVESIFIPHGGVIFACHRVVSERQLSDLVLQSSLRGYSSYPSDAPPVPPSSLSHSFGVDSYPPSQSQRQRPSLSHAAEMSSMYSHPPLHSQYHPSNRGPFNLPANVSHDDSPLRSRVSYPQDADQIPRQWPQNQYNRFSPQSPYEMQDSALVHRFSSPLPTSHHPYTGARGQQREHQHAYLDPMFGPSQSGGRAPALHQPHPAFVSRESFRPPDDHGRDHDMRTGQGHSHLPLGSFSMSDGLDAANRLKTSSRPSGQPPTGVSQCAFCGTTSSPEWRKGTTGIKNLCNACGLRYARTKQKEEGYVPSRRRPNPNGTHSHVQTDGAPRLLRTR
ncbi:hypothetical protein BS47DRAFT_858055 [Hydnum rufescens UP504]|uniref:GATA-type domain-containing protein n=1 Tax=Hydnum rufescens UP504 TaxID=1448309 RepID=A0A9P6AZG1_9AGAM|nr:hypothetical protein BS47DRAFT_858055 [Hydnum rufescens UP504]